MSRLPFTLETTCPGTKARAARFRTLHGEVTTPVFMPVGTQATVKAQTRETLLEAGSQVLLANTYHLMLRPGPEVFQKLGGIHRFMNWDRPVLTDSGGFQIFSLPDARAMQEEGARFTSYVDGKPHLLSPESSIAMQRAIGSDIMMVLDQCIPSTAPFAQAETAMELTHRWAERSLTARGDSPQALFGIVQGACHHDLRRRSAEFLTARPFDGFAIGGLAVGETLEERREFSSLVTGFLPEDKPRYLMGVGTPLDLLEGVNAGVDMFDCIIPSQFAQRGIAFTSHGKIQLRRSLHKFSEAPVDAACQCPACRHYTRAYLHHLVKTDETLGWHLLTRHNLHFYHRLMGEMRSRIQAGTFAAFYEEQRGLLGRNDEDNPSVPGRRRKPVARRLPKLGDYEIVESESGYSSILQLSSGETMHSVSKPSDEARLLYVEQPCLASRLSQTADGVAAPALVIWDVGLGAATNAMAVLECFERRLQESPGGLRPLRLLSFERDLDPLRLAAKDPGRFEHLRHRAPHRLLADGSWTHATGLMEWRLLEGDFLQRFAEAEAPDIILYDPFSYKVDSPLWREEVFARIHSHCGGKPAELYTYSNSTAVRSCLLRAGFFVAAGVGTGPKPETTLAFTHTDGASRHPLAPTLLGKSWLGRWSRSHARYPAELPDCDKPAYDTSIRQHPQFRTALP
jgi:queuine tRNA-ribosyltransferase